jgi:site-specific recombinase XerC
MYSRALKTASRHLVQPASLEAVQYLRGRAVKAMSRSSIHGCVTGRTQCTAQLPPRIQLHSAFGRVAPGFFRRSFATHLIEPATKELETVQEGY